MVVLLLLLLGCCSRNWHAYCWMQLAAASTPKACCRGEQAVWIMLCKWWPCCCAIGPCASALHLLLLLLWRHKQGQSRRDAWRSKEHRDTSFFSVFCRALGLK
jgi:hypothetical protein